MPRFVIERSLENAGRLTADDLQGISAKSVEVLRDLGPDVQWLQSYVVDDKLYCVYIAKDADIIREHARCGGFPCDRVSEVKAVIDPTTAGT